MDGQEARLVLRGARRCRRPQSRPEAGLETRMEEPEMPASAAHRLTRFLRAGVAAAAMAVTAIAAGTGGAHAFQSEGTVRIGSIEAQTGVPAPYGIQALIGSQI